MHFFLENQSKISVIRSNVAKINSSIILTDYCKHSPGLHALQSCARWVGTHTHCPLSESHTVPATVPTRSQLHGWHACVSFPAFRLYICTEQWLHRRPLTPFLHWHCPVSLSHKIDPSTVPLGSQWHGWQPWDSSRPGVYQPWWHKSHRRPSACGRHTHWPVTGWHTEPEMIPAVLQLQDVQTPFFIGP